MKDLSRPKTAALVYSAAHLAVDLCCASALFTLARREGGMALLLYNFCAFAMQLPIGVLSDRLGRGPLFAALGCAMVGTAPLIGQPVLSALIAGLGNGAFHIGAGRDVLLLSRGKASLLGVFVSPGAIGIYLGSLYGPSLPRLELFIPALMLLCAACILLSLGRGEPGEFSMPAMDVGIAALSIVVLLRSYCGVILSFPWRADYAIAMLLAVALGKAAGGFAADTLGSRRAGLLSLGLCAPLFLLGMHSPLLGIAAAFLFNMTMPITLQGLALRLPPGIAFGVTTFGLFLGICPAYLGYGWAGGWTYCLLSLCSMAFLALGLRDKEGI